MNAPPCRPFVEYAEIAQYIKSGEAHFFMWDGNFLCVSYPNQTVDEFSDVGRGTAINIINAKNPLQVFNLMKSNLTPVIMFTENFTNGAWQTETGGYICS